MITPIIESERIILRPLVIGDAEHIYNSWTSDPEVARFMIWELHSSVEVTAEWLKKVEEYFADDHVYIWGLVLKETGKLFGSGGLSFKEELGCYELGYNIMKKYWGQGLTTEAGRVILEFAIHSLGEKRFFCRHAVDNLGSQKVMTKLGFQYSGESSYTSLTGQKTFASKDYYLIVE